MSSSRQFAIMSLHGGQKYYHEVCTNYLSHSAISSIVSGKGSISCMVYIKAMVHDLTMLKGLSCNNVAIMSRWPLIG